ncbi:MAG: hypothetical protein AB7F75_03150 [Planctomycetota bacterium]
MARTRGFVLVIVLAMLGVLGFLALDLFSKSRLTRSLSQNAIALSKATLSARSGLEKGVQATVTYGRVSPSSLPFMAQLLSAGEDRNRNGILDAGEDLDGDGRISWQGLERDTTPSLALLGPSSSQSLVVQNGNVSRGVTWRNTEGNQLCTLRITAPSIDLNAGVDAGEGVEGQNFATDFGVNYTAQSLTHPFNIPLLRFLNSWGNYHKYKAMVRYDKTYDFDRSTNNGLIDSPRNLAVNLIESEYPATRFDDFNPSGNYMFDQNFAPITSEEPLGKRLLAARPAGGFKSVDSALSVVENYVRSWKDKRNRLAMGGAGRWQYADGSLIPEIDEDDIRAIVEEFRDLATVNPIREPGWVFKKGTPPPAPSNEPASPSFFEKHDNRYYLHTKIYNVPVLRIDVNHASESVLAAMVQSPGNVKVSAYNRSEARFNPPAPVIPEQSENNYSCALMYQDASSQFDWIFGHPIFSMTESIQMAKDIEAERRLDMFQFSTRRLGEFIRSWRKGYDAKQLRTYSTSHQFNTQIWGGLPSLFANVSRYFDLFHGHRRVQILAEFLNPHVNDARVIWDEALPLAVENKKNRLIMTQDNPFKGLFFVLDEADGDLMEKGPEACFQAPSFRFSSLGWLDSSNHRRLLTTTVRLYETLDISTQKEFEDSARDPITSVSTVGDWVTYPELTQNTGVAPSTWTGHLALRPKTTLCPWGDKIRLRVPLNGYEPDPTVPLDENHSPFEAWPIGSRELPGPSALPARGVMLNSLNPGPAKPMTSLFPANPGDINQACDLLPGGGIRMSPWNNSPLRSINAGQWDNGKESLLVLRNALVLDTDDAIWPDDETHLPSNGIPNKVLSDSYQGAVSFYLKPRFVPEFSHNNPPPGITPSGGVATLFYMPFSVKDEETYNRCLALYPPNIAEIRSQFVGSLRLTWSQHNSFGDVKRQYSKTPSDHGFTWPAVQPFGSFGGQIAYGPFYFSGMDGFVDPTVGGTSGNVLTKDFIFATLGTKFFNVNICQPNGDGIEGHWRAPNPYSNEMIALEWEIHKYAENREIAAARSHPNILSSTTAAWSIWDFNDDFSAVQNSTAYVNQSGMPLNLFDTSDANYPEYHSVRKCFFLQGPKVIDTISMGRGPVDRRGDLQALVEPGRWNHFFVCWRNLWDVLNNNTPNRGGCLAVYVNGMYRKVSPHPQNFQTNAIFFNFDTSAAYRGSNTLGLNYSSWDPNTHNPYQLMSFQGPKRTGGGGYIYTKTFCVPSSFFIGSASIYPDMPPIFDKGFGLEPSMYPYHSVDAGNLVPNTIYNQHSPRKILIHRRFPPRFYFGFEPHSILTNASGGLDVDRYYPANITWGAYMDLQVFDNIIGSAPFSPLSIDGGFLPELPDYFNGGNSYSPYPGLSSATPVKLFPLNNADIAKAANEGRLVGVSWAAHLPEFHQFWDDQGATPGPDTSDVQRLEMEVNGLGVLLGNPFLSQLPNTPQRHGLELASPLSLTNPSDLYLQMTFKGPEVVMSTPIIEGFAFTFLRYRPQYDAILME